MRGVYFYLLLYIMFVKFCFTFLVLMINSFRLIGNSTYSRKFKERGRVSYSSIVPGTAVVRVQTRSMIFTTCGMSLWVEGYCTLCACRASHN